MQNLKAPWLFALLLLAAGNGRAQGGPDREYRIKAVFLYHFTQFVEWPDSALSQGPMVVGILGNDPFDTYLEEVVKGEKVKDRSIAVERYRRVEDVKNCQVLFISGSENPRSGAIMESLRGRPILTVGESEGFCRQGGMVCFVTRNGKVRFEINLDAVKAANLSVSSKLLRLADVAPPGKE